MAKRRRCKGYKTNGKRCQRPLKGRQRDYCTAECRVRARGRRRASYQQAYFQRQKAARHEQRRIEAEAAAKAAALQKERQIELQIERQMKNDPLMKHMKEVLSPEKFRDWCRFTGQIE